MFKLSKNYLYIVDFVKIIYEVGIENEGMELR